MEFDKETQEKIQFLQENEQVIQNLMMQKQAFLIELNEVENALIEINNSKDDVYKLIGQIMFKTDKNILEADLKKRENLISLRLKSIESKEKDLTGEIEKIRAEVLKKIK